MHTNSEAMEKIRKEKKERVKTERCKYPKREAECSGRGISERRPFFRGVRMRKWGRWVSEIRAPKSRTKIWLGSYSTPEKAARAYDAAVYCLHGDQAPFNFPEDRGFHIPEEQRLALAAHEVKAIAVRHAFSVPLDSKPVSSANVVRSPQESPSSAFTGPAAPAPAPPPPPTTATAVGSCSNAIELAATDCGWDFHGPDGFVFKDAAAIEEVMRILDLL